jgi:hypothetical protein
MRIDDLLRAMRNLTDQRYRPAEGGLCAIPKQLTCVPLRTSTEEGTRQVEQREVRKTEELEVTASRPKPTKEQASS